LNVATEINMPTLQRAAFESDRPFLWTCSDCGKPFDFGRIPAQPSAAAEDALNQDFLAHCEKEHKGSLPIVGLKNRVLSKQG